MRVSEFYGLNLFNGKAVHDIEKTVPVPGCFLYFFFFFFFVNVSLYCILYYFIRESIRLQSL